MSLNRPLGPPRHCDIELVTLDPATLTQKVYWADVPEDDYFKRPEAFEVSGQYLYGEPLTFPEPGQIARVPRSVRLGGPMPTTSAGHLFFLPVAQAIKAFCEHQYKSKKLYFAYNPSCSVYYPWFPALVHTHPTAGGPTHVGDPGTPDVTYGSGPYFCSQNGPNPGLPVPGSTNVGYAGCTNWQAGISFISEVGTFGGYTTETGHEGSTPVVEPGLQIPCFLASDALNFVIGGFAEQSWGMWDDFNAENPKLTGPNPDLWPYFYDHVVQQYALFHRYRTIIIRHHNLEWLAQGDADTEDSSGLPLLLPGVDLDRHKDMCSQVIDAIFGETLGFQTPPGFELAPTDDAMNAEYYKGIIREHFGLDG